MGCPNFSKVHARNYYVVGDETTRWDDELEEEVSCLKDNEDYDMDIECATYHGKEKGFNPISERFSERLWNDRMNAECIMDKSIFDSFGKNGLNFNNFNICMEIYVRGGHYAGMNYDWDIVVTPEVGDDMHLSDYDSVDDMINDIVADWNECSYYTDKWNAGMFAMQRKNLAKWLEHFIDKAMDEADAMCEDICEETYVCGGIFSNGEAVYYKKDSLKGIANNIENEVA